MLRSDEQILTLSPLGKAVLESFFPLPIHVSVSRALFLVLPVPTSLEQNWWKLVDMGKADLSHL